MRLYFIFLFILFCIAGCSQEPGWRYISLTDTLAIPLGDTTAFVVKHRYSPHITTPFFIHLHHNEQTADSALHTYLDLNGGQTIGMVNNRQRFINFTLGQKPYLFDPNRMFTPRGIRQSMAFLSRHHPLAAQEISRLSDSILRLLPPDEPVIAVHNNTNEAYSILSYADGGVYAAEAKALFYNPKMDKDDFVLTTDRQLFNFLKAAAINAVLQDNNSVTDDGSLGYYLGKKARIYVNIEAEHGHFKEQMQLITAVSEGLKNKPAVLPQMSY